MVKYPSLTRRAGVGAPGEPVQRCPFPLVWTTLFLNHVSVLRQSNWTGVFRSVVTRTYAYGGLQNPESDTQGWDPGMLFLTDGRRNPTPVQEPPTRVMKGNLPNSTVLGLGLELGGPVISKCLKLQMCVASPLYTLAPLEDIWNYPVFPDCSKLRGFYRSA